MQQLRQQIASTSLKHGKKSIILNDVAQLEPSDTVIDSERMLISSEVQVVWYVATAYHIAMLRSWLLLKVHKRPAGRHEYISIRTSSCIHGACSRITAAHVSRTRVC